MSRPKILLCVLTGTERQQWINPELSINIMTMIRDTRFDVYYAPQKDMRPWEAARNMAIAAARQIDANYLVSVDNDNFVPSGNLLDIVANAGPAQDVIGLRYGVGNGERGYSLFPNSETVANSQFQEVPEVAGGVLIVHNTVWQKIPRGPWFRWQHADNETLTPAPGCCGEDVFFCRLARQHGLRVWTHTRILAGHYRTTDLTGMVSAFERLSEQAKGAAR